ncbi:MAG: hypothetical protein AAGA92_01390 [Planctomycetota bacterium]
MPALYDSIGLRFEYPDNWSIESETESKGSQVVVSSPETAFWHAGKYDAGTELEPLFDEALAALRSEYRDMEVSYVEEKIDSQHVTGYDVDFYLFDFISTARIRGVNTAGATYLVVSQAEDREMRTVGPVFQAMLASLLRHEAEAARS